jgi:hypothetical protein
MKILLNHLGFELAGQKKAIIDAPADLTARRFSIYHTASRELAFAGELQKSGGVDNWGAGTWHYWIADFSELAVEGEYFLLIDEISPPLVSATFAIAKRLFSEQILSDLVHYIKGQRCTGLYDQADKSRPKWGGEERRDVHGGWYDASGDCSKYLSHLSYANFMNPQQTPQVVWNLIDGHAQLPPQSKWFKERIVDEALHGADYLLRMQDPAGYFYMTVFDQWSKDENRRDICEYKTQKGEKFDSYQAAFRQGGGMAIAALTRASTLHRDGEFTREQYLQAAELGFSHLEQHNLEYLSDHTENIIDDYCVLLAACELLAVSGSASYADAAARRVLNLLERQTVEGWFKADTLGERSYFHAAEAGLPYIALMRFIEVVPASPLVGRIREALRLAYQFEFAITFNSVNNPFGYPRQFVKQGNIGQAQFFIPHDNGTGYWWQGENARLGSIAAAAARAQRVFATESPLVTQLAQYEQACLDWILGANPFDACMLQGWGRNNPRYEVGFYNAPGGVCNGITSGLDDESDIDFKKSEIATMANSWRWTEQWMPHGAWLFLALSTRIGTN